MKKIIFLFGIIALGLVSFNASAILVTAHPKANFYINDPSYTSGDYYDIVVEVLTNYPTDGYAVVFTGFTNPFFWTPIPGTVQVANVWYQTPPVSTDYYTLKIWVQKNGSGPWRSGWSYADMSYVGGNYYFTAFDDITVGI